MNVVSTIISVGMLACIMLGAICLRIWFKDRSRQAYLFLSITSFSLAVYALGEIRMMHASTVDDYVRQVHFTFVAAWLSLTFFPLFVLYYFAAGRAWLMWCAIGLRTLALIVSLTSPYGINFTEITGLKTMAFLGETVSIAVGTRNPLMAIGQISTFLIFAFCIDAAITVWRRGERSVAAWFGGSVVLFGGGRLVDSILVTWGLVNFPLTTSLFFMGIVFAMAWELSSKANRAEALEQKLEKKTMETLQLLSAMNLAADAGQVGVWMRSLDSGRVRANAECRKIFFLPENGDLVLADFHARLYPDDRERILKARDTEFDNTDEVSSEYRIVSPDGDERWIKSRKRLLRLDDGQMVVYGAAADVTERKKAEARAHHLSGMLIDALETERTRLARELHDDLGQRLALLGIKVGMLNNGDGSMVKDRLDELVKSVDVMASDIHRLSHELHPAKLEQLGLIAAIRGFCHEVTETQGLAIDVSLDDIPRSIPNDIALCSYRVVQEALQNIVKHSGADKAVVNVHIQGMDLVLSIEDNGSGFDEHSVKVKDSLGLVSMRERIYSVGGTLDLRSTIGSGTKITAKIGLNVGPKEAFVAKGKAVRASQ